FPPCAPPELSHLPHPRERRSVPSPQNVLLSEGGSRMTETEREQLERAIEEITEIAAGFGLDFFSMRYEICPADIIYTFGAYGMPTRFSHWSFGKSFH